MHEENLFRVLVVLPRIGAPRAKPPRIAIKSKGRILFIDPARELSAHFPARPA